MPAARLTHAERERIAAGLAAGLDYAEIARRLGRPTSTVSREVARNRGPRGYRAEHAALTSSARARRRGRRPAEARQDADRGERATADFERRFVEMVVATGLPAMPARVLACLSVTDSGTRTAAELARSLRVSPASVSTAVGYLERLDMVRRERDPHRRRERYVVDGEIWPRSWSASARSNARWARLAEEGVTLFGADTPTGQRMAQTRAFFEQVYRAMSAGLSHGTPVEPAVPAQDAVTVLAALVHAGTSLTAARIGAALGWPQQRVRQALHDLDARPGLGDPLTLQETGDGYRAVVAADRLTAQQRAALISSAAPGTAAGT